MIVKNFGSSSDKFINKVGLKKALAFSFFSVYMGNSFSSLIFSFSDAHVLIRIIFGWIFSLLILNNIIYDIYKVRVSK